MRVDSVSRRILATPERIFAAFATEGAMERWLPPDEMKGEMLDFDFRDGGAYRMRLSYKDARSGTGKTVPEADEVDVRLIRVEAGKRIEQEVVFRGDDPAFAGTMRMIWTFEAEDEATRVTVRAEDVPHGIGREEHEIGMDSSLAHLAAFLEGPETTGVDLGSRRP